MILLNGMNFMSSHADIKEIVEKWKVRKIVHSDDRGARNIKIYYWIGKTRLDTMNGNIDVLDDPPKIKKILDFAWGTALVLGFFDMLGPQLI